MTSLGSRPREPLGASLCARASVAVLQARLGGEICLPGGCWGHLEALPQAANVRHQVHLRLQVPEHLPRQSLARQCAARQALVRVGPQQLGSARAQGCRRALVLLLRGLRAGQSQVAGAAAEAEPHLLRGWQAGGGHHLRPLLTGVEPARLVGQRLHLLRALLLLVQAAAAPPAGKLLCLLRVLLLLT